MKSIRSFVVTLLLACFCIAPLMASAADAKTKEKPKPYPLKTCLVTDAKLGDMGDPYVIEYEGQEIKFCCKACVKAFKKDPAKYMKKMAEEVEKAKKKAKGGKG